MDKILPRCTGTLEGRVKPEKYRKIREPLAALYDAAAGALALFLKKVCRLRVQTEQPLPRSGPLLVLCSHQGMLDFAVTAAALLPRRLHFVCSDSFFQRPLLAPLLHALGVIPKVQFAADPRCIASILRVLRAGGAVCLYPAGQTSMTGRPGAIAPSVARLVRKSGADVAFLQIHGGFFTRSRFARGLNRGRIDARAGLLFTARQIGALDENEIYRRVCAAVDYDEYRWQRETGAAFVSRHRARGYQNILLLCPRCGARASYSARGNRVRCDVCGNAGSVGPDMRLHADAGSMLPETLTEWHDMLRRDWEKRLRAGTFCMTSPVRCRRWDGRRFAPCGSGTAELSEQALRYEPHGGRPVCLPNQTLSGMRCVPGAYFEAVTPDGALRLYPESGRSAAEWKLAQEYLHERAGGEAKR